MYKRNSGFSLIELLLVLGVICAITVAAFIIYPQVAQARNQAAEQQSNHSDVPVVGVSEQQIKERKQEEERKKKGRFHSEFDNGF